MLDPLAIDQATEAIADAPHVPALLAALAGHGLDDLVARPLDGAGGVAWRLRKVLRSHGHALPPRASLADLAAFPLEEPELEPLRAWAARHARRALLRQAAPADPDSLSDSLRAHGLDDVLAGRALLAVYALDADLASAHHEALKPHSVGTALHAGLPSSLERLLWGVARDAWIEAADRLTLHAALESGAPADPDHEPLWERLAVQWQRATDLAGPGGTGRTGWRAALGSDGATLQFSDGDRVLATLPLARFPPPRPLKLRAPPSGSAGAQAERAAVERDLCAHALDLLRRRHGLSERLRGPSSADHSLRVLELLDTELAAAPAPEAWLGWRVERRPDEVPRLIEVRCTLGSDGAWKIRGKVRDRENLGLLPSDERARTRLSAQRDLGTPPIAPIVRALDALVGHPRVFAAGPGSTPMVLGRCVAQLTLRSQERGVQTSWSLGPHADPLDSAELSALLRDHGDGRLGLLWHDYPHAVLVDVQQARPVATALARAGDWVPPAAVDGFLGRLPGIAARARVDLDPRLAGEERAPDNTPRLRLSALPEGALSVEVRVAPGGPSSGLFEPGRGPDALYGADPVRFVVHRQPADEERQARRLIDALGLSAHPSESHRWDQLELVDAVAFLQRLVDHPEVPVEWLSGSMSVHSASTVHQLRVRLTDSGQWFHLDGELKAGPVTVPLTELLRRIRTGQHCILLDHGEIVALTQELRRDLLTLGALAEPVGEGERLTVLSAPLLSDLVDRGLDLDTPPTWGPRLAALSQPAGAHAAPALQATLRPYQAEGVAWLQQLADWAPGAVLADDMGLGKTVQALALLAHRASEGPALIVVPTSILTTWDRAVAQFTPQLPAKISHGARRERLLHGLGPGDLLLTSWGTLVRDVERLKNIDWATVVLDEAQAIKNARTVRARAVRALPRRFTLALTGTPMENATQELWALLDAVVPGLLGDEASFHTRFATPIAHEPAGPVADTLSRLVRPFLLRRRKSEVATDLPPRQEVEVPVILSPLERKAYEEVRGAVVASLADKKARRDRRGILSALTRLRQLACHPRLVDPAAPASSAKLREVRRVLLELQATGQRALVFSQFTSLLDLLQDHLAPDGLRMARLDGSMSTAQRQAAVDTFQAGDAEVFLVSLHAGGTGLNLTAATYVLHLDAWWNPAVHDQATDRAHRIGQDQPVTVLHFVAEDTVETGILALQKQKRALVDALLDGTDQATRVDADALIALIEEGGIADLDLGTAPALPDAPSSWPAPPADPAAVAALLGDLAWPIAGVPASLADRYERWLTGMQHQRTPKARNHARAAWRLLHWMVDHDLAVEHVDDLEPLAARFGRAVAKADVVGAVQRDRHDAPAAVRAWLASRG